MSRKLSLAEIAALEERLRLNAEQLGVRNFRELQRSPVVQNNLLAIFGTAFGAGLATGLVSKSASEPVRRLLPFLLRF